MPEQVARPVGGDAVELERGPVHHLVHLRLVLPQRAADGDAVTATVGDGGGGGHPQVLLHPALDDPVHGLAGGTVALVPVQAARQPAVGALHRPRRVLAGDVKGGAFVEHERDVRAQRGLHRHRRLGAHEPLAAVQIGAKAHPLLLDGEDRPVGVAAPGAAAGLAAPALDLVSHAPVAHREDLKAARVGDDRAVPAHELVQAAHVAHQLVPGGQEEVEGVAQHHLVAQRGDVARLERLDRTAGGQRDECRGLNLAVRQVQRAPSRAGSCAASGDREHRRDPSGSPTGRATAPAT